ncbi:MAG: ABC transporter permease subunit, partial [Pseudomonadota bacterium]
VIGIAIGVACAGSDRLWAAISPVLDAMQVMPAFVYLIPAIFFFGIGPAPGTLAVMIYALPPMIRLTNLGLRQVPKTMVEAAESFGTTRGQLLLKVQLPQALPSILLGINQTIMMALALAVLTIFVGSGGLGDPVWNAIRRLRVGASVEAGLCIVMMAILFDRLSYAMSAPAPAPRLAPGEPLFRLLPQAWAFHPLAQAVEARLSAIWWFFSRPAALLIRLGPPWVARHIYLVMGLLLIAVIYAWEALLGGLGSYPRALEFSIREPIDAAVEALTVNPAFIAVTKAIRTVTFLYFLKPIDQFLTHLPWWYVTALITGGIYLAAGGRLALLTFLSLIFCGAAGMWEMTMYTITGTAVSVLFCLVLGLPLGILASQIRWVDAVLRPILDTMQTIPSFVYLVPALFFFGGNPTTAVIATVIYAIPPIIRTTTLGLRQIPTEIDEVASAFGTRSWQSLIKVKLPMATPSVMLGVNQTVIMALAMQTVTPIVAGLGLGKEVYDAMNTANTGKGLAAGIGIVLMAIVLDRLSQALTATQRRALGLA